MENKRIVFWKTEEPEEGLEALVDEGHKILRTAFYKNGEWHDLEQGEGWTYNKVIRYIPLEDLK